MSWHLNGPISSSPRIFKASRFCYDRLKYARSWHNWTRVKTCRLKGLAGWSAAALPHLPPLSAGCTLQMQLYRVRIFWCRTFLVFSGVLYRHLVITYLWFLTCDLHACLCLTHSVWRNVFKNKRVKHVHFSKFYKTEQSVITCVLVNSIRCNSYVKV